MNLQLNIEKGGSGDKLGKGLEDSITNYTSNIILGGISGASDVVASSGINLGKGSTDNIIADNIAAAINLTGEQGLTNLANNLNAYTQQLASMGLNEPEELVKIILSEIEKVLGEDGIINSIKIGMQTTTASVNLIKLGLDYATSIANILANISKLMNKLNKMQDVDVICVPSVKESANIFNASLINQMKAQYNALKQQLLVFFNSMICTSNDAVLNNITMSIDNILEVIEPAIEPTLQQYTGHTTAEIRNICNKGFTYIGMIERSAANKRKEKTEDAAKPVNEDGGDVSTEDNAESPLNENRDASVNDAFKRIISSIDKNEFKLSKDEQKKLKDEKIEKSKQRWKEKSEDLKYGQAKEKLMEWLSSQSITIQNGFYLIIIKDMIDRIKIFCSQLQNTSTVNQVDLLNILTNILGFFEDLGLTPDAQGISLNDLRILGITVAGTIAETAINSANNVLQTANTAALEIVNNNSSYADYNNTIISNNNISNYKSTNVDMFNTSKSFAEQSIASATNGSDIVSNAPKSSASNIISNIDNQVMNAAIDTGMNSSIIDSQTLTNNISKTETFTYTQSNENKNINIDITLNKNPYLHIIEITNFIKQFKYGNNKNIFNNGALKQIKDSFKEAWDINDTVILNINAIVDGITKHYIFTINVNQNYRNDEESSSITQNNEYILSENITGTSANATDTLIGSESSITGKTSNLSNNIKTNTINGVENAGTHALSQLAKTHVNIDMGQIEKVLKGKVLMFDEVVQFLKILQPVIQSLKVLCHILENYVINKRFVKDKGRIALSGSIREAAQLINGLKDLINLKDTNFFTVRTKETSDWAISTFNKQPDKAGMITIDVLGTTKLNTYLSLHHINPDFPLNLLKGTTMYFDNWGITNGNYNDGTTNEIDNIEVNRYANEIYYDSYNRSSISSEILRARKKNIDPLIDIENNISEENDNSTESLLKMITIKTDEMEGTQTIDMCNLNLCPQPLKEEKLPEKSAVIIEFGDEYTLGDKVQYNLNVKPGDTIKEGQIIAYITYDNKQIPVRTQYTGTVRATENNEDFAQLYPSVAKRHFIIDDPDLCMPIDYNINDIFDLQKKFKKTTELESFILNCLPISILPILLAKADRDGAPFIQIYPSIPGAIQTVTGVYSEYDKIIQKFDSDINNFSIQLKNISSEEHIKAGVNGETTVLNNKQYVNIRTDLAKQLFEEMKAVRQNMIKCAIGVYNNAIDNENNDLNGDYTYEDCIGLAYFKNKFTRGADDKIEYNNYYINLLQTIPDSQKMTMAPININISDIQGELEKFYLTDEQRNTGAHIDMTSNNFLNINNVMSQISDMNSADDGPDYIEEYRTLITDIIDNRLSYEQKTKTEMIKQFNQFYNTNIKHINNAFNNLKNRIQDLTNKQEILQQIKMDKLGNYYNNLNTQADKDNFRTDDNNKLNNDKNYYNSCQQAVTMFMYLINSDINENLKKPLQITSSVISTQTDKESLLYAISLFNAQYINEYVIYKNQKYVDIYNLVQDIIKNVYDNSNAELTLKRCIQTVKEVIPDITEDEIEYIINAINAISSKDNELSTNTMAYFNRKLNEFFYTMTVEESQKIIQFWNKVLIAYKTEYNIDSAIESITNYANNMNSFAKWPQSINIKIDQTSYELYTFLNPEKQATSTSTIPFTDLNIDELSIPMKMPEPVIDLNDIKDIRKNDSTTIFDYDYWLVYMLNATLFTLIPTFWADGFDIPPYMTPLLLPAIYLPIAPPVMIPKVNMLIVFGIAIRGIWPAPIILMVNLSSDDADAMIFLKLSMEIAKDIFKRLQETIENSIPAMVKSIINKYISENEIALKAIEKFRTYSSIIRAIPIEDKALIEKKFNEELEKQLNQQTKLNSANETIKNSKNAINEYKQNTMEEIDKKVNQNNIQKKLMKYDRRQVIIREADLENGPEPM